MNNKPNFPKINIPKNGLAAAALASATGLTGYGLSKIPQTTTLNLPPEKTVEKVIEKTPITINNYLGDKNGGNEKIILERSYDQDGLYNLAEQASDEISYLTNQLNDQAQIQTALGANIEVIKKGYEQDIAGLKTQIKELEDKLTEIKVPSDADILSKSGNVALLARIQNLTSQLTELETKVDQIPTTIAGITQNGSMELIKECLEVKRLVGLLQNDIDSTDEDIDGLIAFFKPKINKLEGEVEFLKDDLRDTEEWMSEQLLAASEDVTDLKYKQQELEIGQKLVSADLLSVEEDLSGVKKDIKHNAELIHEQKQRTNQALIQAGKSWEKAYEAVLKADQADSKGKFAKEKNDQQDIEINSMKERLSNLELSKKEEQDEADRQFDINRRNETEKIAQSAQTRSLNNEHQIQFMAKDRDNFEEYIQDAVDDVNKDVSKLNFDMKDVQHDVRALDSDVEILKKSFSKLEDVFMDYIVHQQLVNLNKDKQINSLKFVFSKYENKLPPEFDEMKEQIEEIFKLVDPVLVQEQNRIIHGLRKTITDTHTNLELKITRGLQDANTRMDGIDTKATTAQNLSENAHSSLGSMEVRLKEAILTSKTAIHSGDTVDFEGEGYSIRDGRLIKVFSGDN